jgi:hypothetical protein
VARHIFQACPVWIYSLSNITSIHNLSTGSHPSEEEKRT